MINNSDTARLLTRRRVLGLFGGAAAGVVLSGCGGSKSASDTPMVVTHASSLPVSRDVPPGPAPSATPSGGPPPPGMNPLEEADASASPVPAGTIPEEPAGPYPADGSNGPNVLTLDGVHRKDITGSFGTGTKTAAGVPMTVRLTITNHADGGAPYDGAAVYLWQCDRDGNYSMYGQNLATDNYLRGVQVAFQDGVVEFTSIFPGAPTGRWPHLNLQIYRDLQTATDGGEKLRTTQIALPREACEAVYATPGYAQSKARLAQVSLDTDPVFRNGYSLELARASGSVSEGYTVSLAVPV
jgi:protocatechuate 3,4-dioxygenase beta subunit